MDIFETMMNDNENVDSISSNDLPPLPIMEEEVEECCLCSEDEDEENNIENPSTCYLCLNGDDRFGPVNELNAMHKKLSGKICNSSIYDILHEHYVKNIVEPLKQQNMKVVELSKRDIYNHYKHHRCSIRDMLLDDIQFMNILQNKLRQNGIFIKKLTGLKLKN